MSVLELLPLPPEKRESAELALACHFEAEEMLFYGNWSGAESRFRASDAHWSAALTCLGYHGDVWSRRSAVR